jgi:hypothetical protein
MEFLYGGNGEEEMAVDDDRVLRRGRTGDDGDDPKTKGAAAMGRGRETFEEIFKRTVRWIYIPMCRRCDRVVKLGGTEMDNCRQLCTSVTPKITTRLHRDENLDQFSCFGWTEFE